MSNPSYGWSYRQDRDRLLASGPLCVHCGWRPADRADHQPPLSLHDHVEGAGCCTLVPSCLPCEQRQSGLLGGTSRWPRMARAELEEPAGFPVGDAVWDVPWLDALRDVPANAWWPRLMTVPHPRAVGSIGADMVGWVRTELGVVLRWWQVLFVVRLLEVDEAGELVWTSALLTLARQCGKSLVVFCLCEWRSEQAARFGEPQLVLHTADSLEHAKAVWNRAHRRALAHGWGLRRAAGEYEIDKGTGTWLVRSQTAAVGYTASLAVADECHAIKPVTIDERLGPTTVEAAQSQILLVSTAARDCSELFPRRRAGALARLGDPDAELIVEWSAPRGASVLDESARRQGSPHWHKRRAEEIRTHAERAAPYESQLHPHELVVGVRTQWHNEWPLERVAGKGEPLLDEAAWADTVSTVDSDGPLWVGVEDHRGQGAAVAVCGSLPDQRFVLGGRLCDSRSAAYGLAAEVCRLRPGSTLVVGASLAADVEVLAIQAVTVRKAGIAETGASLSLLRDLLTTGRVVHDDVSPQLDDQVLACRVTPIASGLSLVTGPRSDLLRAAVWALRVAATGVVPTPAIH